MTPENGVNYRLTVVERQIEPGSDFDKGVKLAEKHEVELHGERGVYRALSELAHQLQWVQRALWGLAASVTVAAIVFALGGGHHP
jgi:hypothetical protein